MQPNHRTFNQQNITLNVISSEQLEYLSFSPKKSTNDYSSLKAIVSINHIAFVSQSHMLFFQLSQTTVDLILLLTIFDLKKNY